MARHFWSQKTSQLDRLSLRSAMMLSLAPNKKATSSFVEYTMSNSQKHILLGKNSRARKAFKKREKVSLKPCTGSATYFASIGHAIPSGTTNTYYVRLATPLNNDKKSSSTSGDVVPSSNILLAYEAFSDHPRFLSSQAIVARTLRRL